MKNTMILFVPRIILLLPGLRSRVTSAKSGAVVQTSSNTLRARGVLAIFDRLLLQQSETCLLGKYGSPSMVRDVT
jgi:hypothetical protein